MSRLSQYFTGIITKRLSAVEIDPKLSNQHEFNGILQMCEIFGRDKRKFEGVFIYFTDEEEKTISTEGSLTWYDARERNKTRTEYRLYFQSNLVIDQASPGDLLVIGRRPNDILLTIIIKAGTTIEQQIQWLFGIQNSGPGFSVKNIEGELNKEIGYAERTILEFLGIETEITESQKWIELILNTFGERFPTTKIFSEFTRNTLPDISSIEDPDRALINWINQEEMLFRLLEKHIVQKKIDVGFEDVDDFIKYSLSIQNTRKSRAGLALENHLAHIFRDHNLSFSQGVATENNSKPDFIFPGIQQYHSDKFPVENLTMLGSKSTCKDRWRQVLSEAKKINQKHLFTLEPGISKNQTDEMVDNGLQLVLPQNLHSSYQPDQANWLMNLSEFIYLVRIREI